MRTGRDFALFLAICGLGALPGCSDRSADKDGSGNKAAPAAPAVPDHGATANASDPGPGPQSLTSKTPAFEFTYSWPAEAAAIPELNSWLRGNGAKMREENEGEAKSDEADARKDGYPFITHSYEEKFAVVANTPRLLALLSDGYVFTGGAHGMPVNTAILWDKATKKRLATAAMIDVPRLTNVGGKTFCDALDKERQKRRGEPVRHDDPNELDDFVKCVDMKTELILPVAKDPKTATALDTIRVVIAPYDAGPYAEGTYVIDLPVDATLLTAVKKPYQAYFTAAK